MPGSNEEKSMPPSDSELLARCRNRTQRWVVFLVGGVSVFRYCVYIRMYVIAVRIIIGVCVRISLECSRTSQVFICPALLPLFFGSSFSFALKILSAPSK